MRLNEMFIFPFEKIQKGENIIIYGMGNVGKCFYNQVTTLHYCNVLAVADRKAKWFMADRYHVIPPEQISEYDYDHIIVAVASEPSARYIKHNLNAKWKIPEDKIIFSPNRKVPIDLTGATLHSLLQSEEAMQHELYSFSTGSTGNMEYFSSIVNEMFQVRLNHDTAFMEEIKARFMYYLEAEPSAKNRIVILRILYSAGYFDGSLLELYINCIRRIKNFDFRMWLLYDASIIESNDQNCRYENFYLDKRKTIEENAFHYYAPTPRQSEGKWNNKVAIISFFLGKMNSSHNALIVPYANEMRAQGKDVAVFPMDLFRYRCGECFIQPLVALEQNSAINSELHKQLFHPDIHIYYNDGEDIGSRISNFMRQVCEFDPAVVYDFCGEYSFFSPIVHKLFPVVVIPMRGYASSSVFDVYMCRDKNICLKENQVYHSIQETQMEEALVCSFPAEEGDPYSREDYGIAEDAFVITTVGYRLKAELTIEFVDCVCAFLKDHPRACWILVGGKICNYIRESYPEYLSERRIIDWGFEKDLGAFYAMCNIYWNPCRMGAGGSIVTAMRHGIPIVTTNFPSDVLPRIGAENAISGGYEECRAYAEALYSDPHLYEEKSRLMIERMNISCVPDYVSKLLEVGRSLCLQRSDRQLSDKNNPDV